MKVDALKEGILYEKEPLELGIDPASMGGNKCCLVERQGNKLLNLYDQNEGSNSCKYGCRSPFTLAVAVAIIKEA